MKPEYIFLVDTPWSGIDSKPNYNITLHNHEGQVGKLDFNSPKLIFTGNAEESAKVFIDWVAVLWEQRLKEERETEREACAKLCEEYDDVVDRLTIGYDIGYAAVIRTRSKT